MRYITQRLHHKDLCPYGYVNLFPLFVSSFCNKVKCIALPMYVFCFVCLLQCRWYGQIQRKYAMAEFVYQCTKHVKRSEIKSSLMTLPSMYIPGRSGVVGPSSMGKSALMKSCRLGHFPMEAFDTGLYGGSFFNRSLRLMKIRCSRRILSRRRSVSFFLRLPANTNRRRNVSPEYGL